MLAPVSGRMEVRALRAAHRETERVGDLARGHFVIAHEPRQDPQPRRVRRGPAGRTEHVGAEVEDGPGAGMPRSVGLRVRREQLVELPIVAVYDHHVPIAGRAEAAFDGER